ncbi:MAG TPA: 2-C-methyl-D-erythritol 2,4-cyclodiphosphate synthase [Cyclobacteriaceae bacterium]|nr:2-C-methyl-D-erythritol 2,4-cyclodiphosphate synthase [Cyclobacteriaceae bacterium]
MKIRVGLGYDVHQLEEGRDFFLGGIKIPASKGAVGHSDADVLIHAICDAILGAAGLRDIGFHFSNKDEKYKNIDSKILLQEVMRMSKSAGWNLQNVDCTLVLESPKINPHIAAMKEVLLPILGVEDDALSIKATTSESIGFVGREEGVCAHAVALLTKD